MVSVLDKPVALIATEEPQIDSFMSALTRRRVISGGFATIYAATAATRVRGQEASPVATRQVVDPTGPVTVPAHPQRVIAEGNSTLGNMIALGMKPVGAAMNTNSLPFFLADQIEGIVSVNGESGIDIEKALSLNPDLLIAIWGSGDQGWNMENVDTYKEAVTTFCYEQNYVYEEDIKQNVLDIAVALGVEDRAAAVLKAYDDRVAKLRQAVLDVGFNDKPVTVVRVFNDGGYSIRVGTSESIIFRAVGIPQPEGQRNPEDFSLELSLERLDVLNSAYAVIIYIDDNSAVKAEEMLDNPVWQSVTAVREKRVIFVNSGVWNSIEILGAMAIMDDVENLLLPLAQAG
jgi:ABC-type Fe3+-hydroxamate transport system substrate-binding protein